MPADPEAAEPQPRDQLKADEEAAHSSVGKLERLGWAFDAACRELGIGLAGLDVLKREQLVKRAIRIANASDPRGSAFPPPSRS